MAVNSWRAASVICAGECGGDSGLELSANGDIASSTKFSSNCSFTFTIVKKTFVDGNTVDHVHIFKSSDSGENQALYNYMKGEKKKRKSNKIAMKTVNEGSRLEVELTIVTVIYK